MRRLLRSEKGQTLPLVVLFLLVLLGVLAMVLDGGYGFVQKRRAQNAADAGALAGALAIVNGEYRDAVVRQTVNQYATANGAVTTDMRYLTSGGVLLANPGNGIVPTAASAISVTTQIPFATFFARVLGIPTMTAVAQARAQAISAAMPSSYPGLAPIGVPTNFYDSCTAPTARCDLWDSQYRLPWGTPAAFKGVLDLSNGTAGGSKPQNVSDWTLFGYPGEVAVDAAIPSITGNYGNNIAAALRARITANPGGIDSDGVVWGTVDIIIWDNYSNGRITVAKFGRFKIRYTDIYGSSVRGKFISFVVPGHDRGDDDPAGPKIVVLR